MGSYIEVYVKVLLNWVMGQQKTDLGISLESREREREGGREEEDHELQKKEEATLNVARCIRPEMEIERLAI